MARLIAAACLLAWTVAGAVATHAQAAPPAPPPDTVPVPAPGSAPAAGARPPSLSLLDVRLACVNPQRTARVAALCQLPLSRTTLRDTITWKLWDAEAATPGIADAIRNDARFDPNQLKLADVIDNLEEGVRARILTRLYADVAHFREATRKLETARLAELFHAATDSILPDTAGTDAQRLASRLRALIGTADTLDDRRIGELMQKDVIGKLQSSELVLMLSRAPTLQREVVKTLTGDDTVADVITRPSADEGIRRIITRAANDEFAPTTAARPRTSIDRQSDLIWGATDFVVDRVQQQLQAFALQGFATRLCRDVGATVLRESCVMLRSESFGLSRPGVTLLRSAVRQDLQSLPYSILEWTYGRYATRLDPVQADQLLTAVHVTHFALGATRAEDPWLALAEVADHFRANHDTVAALVARSKTVVDSLARARAPTRRLEEARAQLGTAQARLSALANSHQGAPVSRLILSVAELASTRFDALRLRNVVPEDVRPEELLRYQLIAMMANRQERDPSATGLPFAAQRFVPVVLAVDDDLQRLRRLRARADSLAAARPDTARGAGAVQLQLAHEAFSIAETILSQAAQLDEFKTPHGFARLGAAQRVVVAVRDVVFPVLNGEYSTGLLALRRQVAPFLPADSASTLAWTRGLVFVSDLVNAGNADQVNAALGRFADTGGGFAAKRNSRTARFSLNAFGGVYGGFNGGALSGETAGDEHAAFAGIYLPVGVEVVIPWTVRVRARPLGRFGVFVQAVDLGALASWRLNDSKNVDERPQVGIAQVISPGAFLVFDVQGAPLTLGYGWAQSPALRKATQVGTTPEKELDATRRGFFIAVDIPLFP